MADQTAERPSFAPREPRIVPGRRPLDGHREQSRAEQVLAAGQLTIRSERRGADHIVALSGEVDLATAHAVDDELRAAEMTDARQIILDLSDLSFIDSTGVHLVIKAAARSSANGNRLRLRRGSPHVQRIFETTGVTARIPFIDS